MSSTSGTHDSPDGTDADAVDAADGPRHRSTASAGALSESDRRPGYHERVHIAALTTEVEALEAEVETLEAEVEALERAVESEERRRQQVIDNYEAIVAARSEPDDATEGETDRATGTDSAAFPETAGWRPLNAVASGLERLAARLRRSDE